MFRKSNGGEPNLGDNGRCTLPSGEELMRLSELALLRLPVPVPEWLLRLPIFFQNDRCFGLSAWSCRIWYFNKINEHEERPTVLARQKREGTALMKIQIS